MTTTVQLAHLYPEHLNLYGDRGNVLALYQRCLWRGIALQVTGIGLGDELDSDEVDLLFMGGGQDAQQLRIQEDFQTLKASAIKAAVANGAVMLGICGGYQLMGHYYQPHEGDRIDGLGLIDATTVAGPTRLIGNVLLQREDGTQIVGFENHSGLTYCGEGVTPLGRVIKGHGNNGQDQTEGAVQGNLYGSYLHGALLPKNPTLTDELLLKALQKKYGPDYVLPALSNHLEEQAHQVASTLK